VSLRNLMHAGAQGGFERRGRLEKHVSSMQGRQGGQEAGRQGGREALPAPHLPVRSTAHTETKPWDQKLCGERWTASPRARLSSPRRPRPTPGPRKEEEAAEAEEKKKAAEAAAKKKKAAEEEAEKEARVVDLKLVELQVDLAIQHSEIKVARSVWGFGLLPQGLSLASVRGRCQLPCSCSTFSLSWLT